MSSKILEKLSGGDKRSIGRSDEVAEEVLKSPELFKDLFQGLYSEDEVVRMRAADVIEKVTIENPELLQDFKKELIEEISKINQQEVQWHLAQLYPRLLLSASELEQVSEILFNFIETSKSNIVKVFSLQSLWDLSGNNSGLRKKVEKLMGELERNGAPSIKSRIRKLKG